MSKKITVKKVVVDKEKEEEEQDEKGEKEEEVKYCHVAECRYPLTHVTSAHQCGKCQKYGHGIIECDDQDACDELIKFASERMPPSLQCTQVGCRFKFTHSNEGHQCGRCFSFGHSALQCPSSSNSIPPPSTSSSSSLGFIGSSAMSAIPFSAGSLPSATSFPWHPSSSSTSSSSHKSKKGSSAASASISFQCPMCRTPNTVLLSQPNVYNVEVECVVCNDAKAQVFNVNCGHICLCWKCAKDLK